MVGGSSQYPEVGCHLMYTNSVRHGAVQPGCTVGATSGGLRAADYFDHRVHLSIDA